MICHQKEIGTKESLEEIKEAKKAKKKEVDEDGFTQVV
jgi:hypothetical protein